MMKIELSGKTGTLVFSDDDIIFDIEIGSEPVSIDGLILEDKKNE